MPTATAVVCWDGGVYVGSAPDLIYLKDTDGDGKADVRRVVFTGFGKDLAGESIMNSFRWGLDNRFHVSTNNAGGDVGRAGQPKAKTVSVRGHGFLFDPRSETFELTGGGGQHGMSMDDWGRTYVCANSDPFQLVMYDSRYLARNPYLQAPPPRSTSRRPASLPSSIASALSSRGEHCGRGCAVRGLCPAPMRADRRRASSPAPPGSRFTVATPFRPNSTATCSWATCPTTSFIAPSPVPKGVLVTAKSAEVGREFLASADNYFRPVQMANGPDGCLWVIDMYRELIEGAAFLPPVDSQAHGRRQWRGPRPHLAHRARRAQAEHAQAEQGNDRRAGRAAGTPERLAPRYGVAVALPAAGPVRRRHRYDSLPPDPVHRWEEHTPSTRWRGWERSGRTTCSPHSPTASPVSANTPCDSRNASARTTRGFRARMEAMVGDPDPLVRYQLAFSLGALAGDKTRPCARRSGDSRRGRSLDSHGHSQLRDGLRRRRLPAARRRCRLSARRRRADVPDRARGTDRREPSGGRRTWF